MEKITREELMKKLNLSDYDLQKVAGGDSKDISCEEYCLQELIRRDAMCDEGYKYGTPKEIIDECHENISRLCDVFECERKCEAGEIVP